MSTSNLPFDTILSLEETRAYRRFPVSSIISSLNFPSRSADAILDCCHRIAEYPFDEIKVDDKYRETLARLFAQTWLLRRVNFELICRFCLPLSLLLDQNYEFDFDQQKIFSELFSHRVDEVEYPKLSTHPFRYDERLGIFTELKKLSSLSLPTKFAFALLVLESDFVKGFVPGNSRIDFKLFSEDFAELERDGLLITKPTPVELLRSLESEDLKQFADKMKLRVFEKKNDLIQEIILKVPLHEIQGFVQTHLEMESPVLPTMAHLPLLRKFMSVEAYRFDIYLEWLAFKLYKMPSVIKPLLVNRIRPGDTFMEAKHEDSVYFIESRKPDFLFRYKAEDTYVLESFWDSKCEEIIDQSALDDSIKEIINYLFHIDAVERLKKHFGNFHWKYALKDFIAFKHGEKYHPTAMMMFCPGCGHKFREYSVNWNYVLGVKGNIQFCSVCYQKIFTHENYANDLAMTRMNETTMLDLLRKLSTYLERIPTQEFMESFPLRLPYCPSSKQISVGTILLSMPSKKLYVERFGSWMKSLDLAGVLEGGYIQRARGIQVFAKDGHFCLSLAEKIVDDWLSAHGVPHEKEPKYPFHVDLNPNKLLRADWKVNEILIEYAGLMNDYEYAIKMERKKSLVDILNLEVIVLNERNLDKLDRELGKLLIEH